MKFFLVSLIVAVLTAVSKIFSQKWLDPVVYSYLMAVVASAAGIGSIVVGAYFRLFPEECGQSRGVRAVVYWPSFFVVAVVMYVFLVNYENSPVDDVYTILIMILVSIVMGLAELYGTRSSILRDRSGLLIADLSAALPLMAGLLLLIKANFTISAALLLVYGVAFVFLVVYRQGVIFHVQGYRRNELGKASVHLGNALASMASYMLPLVVVVLFDPLKSSEIIASYYFVSLAVSVNILFINRYFYSSRGVVRYGYWLLFLLVVLEALVGTFAFRAGVINFDRDNSWDLILYSSFVLIAARVIYSAYYARMRIRGLNSNWMICAEAFRVLAMFFAIYLISIFAVAEVTSLVFVAIAFSNMATIFVYRMIVSGEE